MRVTTQARIAGKLEIQASVFNRMVNGKQDWSKEMAIKASEASGVDIWIFLKGTPAEIHSALEKVYGPFRASYDD